MVTNVHKTVYISSFSFIKTKFQLFAHGAFQNFKSALLGTFAIFNSSKFKPNNIVKVNCVGKINLKGLWKAYTTEI